MQFLCNEVSGGQLYDSFWEAVRWLKLSGFCVLALVYDGLTANRRLFHLHNPQASPEDVHKLPNPYSKDNHFVYFLSDVPHLFKTTRNAWYKALGI